MRGSLEERAFGVFSPNSSISIKGTFSFIRESQHSHGQGYKTVPSSCQGGGGGPPPTKNRL